jgi:hypothetical protein
MARIIRLGLAVMALAAFGWALSSLKPLPQVILAALTSLAFIVDYWAGARIKPFAFLFVSSVTTLFGFLFAGSTLVTLAYQQLFPTARRAMPIGTLIVGAAVGLGLFATCFLWMLKPAARIDRIRRAGVAALLAVALISVAIGRLVY